MAKREKLSETREKSMGGASKRELVQALTRAHAPAINIPQQKILPTPTSTECAILVTVYKIGGAVPSTTVLERVRRALKRESFGLAVPLSPEAFAKIVDRLADPSRDLIAVDAGRNLSLLFTGKLVALSLPKRIGVDVTGELAEKVAETAQMAPHSIRHRERKRQRSEEVKRINTAIDKIVANMRAMFAAAAASKPTPSNESSVPLSPASQVATEGTTEQ